MFLVLFTLLISSDNNNIFDKFFSENSDVQIGYNSVKSDNDYCWEFVSVAQDTNKYSYEKNITKKTGLFMPANLIKEGMDHGKKMNSRINFEKREKWIAGVTQNLAGKKDAKIYETILLQEYTSEENQYYKKYIKLSKDRASKLVFSDGSFLVFTCHSVYDSPEIGDVTVAVNEKNIAYKNDGHVCGGIISFVELQNKAVHTSHDFIRNFKSDTDNKSWIILKR
jgi:peptide methionine sulfoxide reductase MsrA